MHWSIVKKCTKIKKLFSETSIDNFREYRKLDNNTITNYHKNL